MPEDNQKEEPEGAIRTALQPFSDTPIETMSLQEKFIELRRFVGGNYDLAKSGEAARTISPALDMLGVNFEAISEQNTQIKTINTQSGIMFLYESDLTLCWTNANNEDDTYEVTTHAIAWGTDPAKVKGAAWEQAVKCYIFVKFGIDTCESVRQSAQSASQPIKASQGEQQQPQPDKAAPGGQTRATRTPSAAQLDRFYRKAESAGLTKEQAVGRVSYLYHKTPDKMTPQEYDDACKRMDDTAMELKNGGAKS